MFSQQIDRFRFGFLSVLGESVRAIGADRNQRVKATVSSWTERQNVAHGHGRRAGERPTIRIVLRQPLEERRVETRPR